MSDKESSSYGPIRTQSNWGGGDDGGEDRRVDSRMTREQLTAAMASLGQTPKVFKARKRIDPASYFDDDVEEEVQTYEDSRVAGAGHGQNQHHRAHQVYEHSPDVPVGHGQKQASDCNKPLPSLPPPSTAELNELRSNVAEQRAKFEAIRSVSDSHPLVYSHPNNHIDVKADPPSPEVPTRSASDATPLARTHRKEDIDLSAVPRPLTIVKKRPSAALSNATASSSEQRWETPPSTPLPKALVGRRVSQRSQLSQPTPSSPLAHSVTPGDYHSPPTIPQRTTSQRTPNSSTRRASGHRYGRAPPGPPPAFATPAVPPLHHHQRTEWALIEETAEAGDHDEYDNSSDAEFEYLATGNEYASSPAPASPRQDSVLSSPVRPRQDSVLSSPARACQDSILSSPTRLRQDSVLSSPTRSRQVSARASTTFAPGRPRQDSVRTSSTLTLNRMIMQTNKALIENDMDKAARDSVAAQQIKNLEEQVAMMAQELKEMREEREREREKEKAAELKVPKQTSAELASMEELKSPSPVLASPTACASGSGSGSGRSLSLRSRFGSLRRAPSAASPSPANTPSAASPVAAPATLSPSPSTPSGRRSRLKGALKGMAAELANSDMSVSPGRVVFSQPATLPAAVRPKNEEMEEEERKEKERRRERVEKLLGVVGLRRKGKKEEEKVEGEEMEMVQEEEEEEEGDWEDVEEEE